MFLPMVSRTSIFSVINIVSFPRVNLSLDNIEVEKGGPNDEQRLMQMLFDSYEKAARPVIRASSTATVAIGLTLIHIFAIEWVDERFFWNPDEFGNVKQLTVPAAFVWTPDIVLYNNAIDFAQGLMQANVIVSPDGNCFWAPPAKFRSLCKLDVTYFPFDHQICQLRFGSWLYDGWELNVTRRSEKITMDSYTDNGEWAIVSTEVRRHVNFYTCCGDTPFPEIQFRIHLRRRTLFYMYNIITPCVMLAILVLLQFHLPCESGEKVTFGLTVLLAYSVYSFKIEENMPETSDVVPLIAIYVVCNMSISAISVTFSVIVLCQHHGGSNQRRVPAWLRAIAHGCIAPIVRWHVQTPEKRIESLLHSLHPTGIQTPCHRASACIVAEEDSKVKIFVPSCAVVQRPKSALAKSIGPKKRVKIKQDQEDVINNCEDYSKCNGEPGKRLSHDRVAITTETLKNLQRQVVEDALGEISFIKYQFDTEALNKELQDEWRQIALIFDRFYFWLALAMSVSMSVSLLIIAPFFSMGRLYKV